VAALALDGCMCSHRNMAAPNIRPARGWTAFRVFRSISSESTVLRERSVYFIIFHFPVLLIERWERSDAKRTPALADQLVLADNYCSCAHFNDSGEAGVCRAALQVPFDVECAKSILNSFTTRADSIVMQCALGLSTNWLLYSFYLSIWSKAISYQSGLVHETTVIIYVAHKKVNPAL